MIVDSADVLAAADVLRGGDDTRPHATCGAKLKTRPGELCPNPPMRGGLRCRMHGGSSGQAKAAAERRQQEAAALAVVARYGVPRHIDWHVAMQEALDETYGNVLALRDLIVQLEPEALTWGDASVVEIGASEFPGTNTTATAGITAVVELYGRERDRLFKMAHDCGKLGLEVRRQQIDEAQQQQIGMQVVDALVACLQRWGLDDAAHRQDVLEELGARQLAGRELGS